MFTTYTAQEELDIAKRDLVFVGQTGRYYLIHQFKRFVGAHTECNVEWEGKSTLAPDSSTVYMQIFNQVTDSWETIDFVYDADYSNFELSAHIDDITDYKDPSNVVSCRVYQYAPSDSIFYTDYFGILYPIVYGDSFTDKGTTYTDQYSEQGNTFTDSLEVKGTTFIDSLVAQNNSYTDNYSEKDTEFVRNYPPNVSEKILNK